MPGPAIRLSAFMGVGVIYVMTHDSIGLGEDGPTHQPVEHLAALRAIPGLYVYRPADPVETAECWALALQRRDAPVAAGADPPIAAAAAARSRMRKTARRAAPMCWPRPMAQRQVTLLATGSEVSRRDGRARGAGARTGSAPPSFRCRAGSSSSKRPKEYQDAVLGSAPRVGVEAAVRFGWDRWLGPRGAFIGMEGFGASAPGEALFPHFGITPEKVAEAARSLL